MIRSGRKIALLAALLSLLSYINCPAAGASGPCASDANLTGCGHPGRISVGGDQGGGPNRGDSTGGPGGPPIRLLSCVALRADALLSVRTLGTNWSALCSQWIPVCRKQFPRAPNAGAALVAQVEPSGRWNYQGMTCLGTQPPEVTPEMVRQRVVRLIPSATIGLAPRDATLVNIETVMWVDAPATRTLPAITILGQQVVVRLKLDHVDWNFGDGSSATSDGPGKAYDEQNDPCHGVRCPDYFGHFYRDTGRTNIAAAAYWQASFTVDGGNAVNIPGTVAGPAGRAEIVVKQARAVLVPNS